MDYKRIAADIIENVGGKDNVKNLTHCFTRLRFVLKDNSKANKEYDVGRCALMIVEHATGVILPEDEAGNIAYHFINAQVNHPYNEKNRRITRITEGVLDIVKYYYHMVYNEEDISYSRYLTHVRLFVQRLMSDNQLPENVSSLLYENIAAACESEFACVDAVQDYIYKETGKTMTGQEKLYLAVHINRIRN